MDRLLKRWFQQIKKSATSFAALFKSIWTN
jgi:hypothetical protein